MVVSLSPSIVDSSIPLDPGPCDVVRWPDGESWSSGLADIDAAIDLAIDVDDELVSLAGRLGSLLPRNVDAALSDFADRSNHAGALLLRDLPIGPLPSTPPHPDSALAKDVSTELTLLTVARRLGQPVGYAPEHGGRVVQNLVPTREAADLQMSTSSSSTLMFHTETAFHPHRPRYLALLCLRGNPEAATTLAPIFDILDALPERTRATTIATMFEPRFRTAVDTSFLPAQLGEPDTQPTSGASAATGNQNDPQDHRVFHGAPHALLSGTLDEPTFVFDADLTVGLDADAERVVHELNAAIENAALSVVLEPGDLIVIDNNRAVHGRSPFRARFDGTDRWLQRAFIVSDLAPSAADRQGRVIVTQFTA